MTLTISATTLCWCLHILAKHEGDDEHCGVDGCRCNRFSPGARTSSHHYQRGQRTASKRVARLEPGDLVLVGYPGHEEFVRGADGKIVWEQRLGEDKPVPAIRHIDDQVLRAVSRKTGALMARVTGRRRMAANRTPGWHRTSPSTHVIETDLGDLAPMFGTNSVLVLA